MEDLYAWKDMLMVLFNLIDYNHSGFISRNEFSDVIKLILHDENAAADVNEAYIEELTLAMDFDKNGKIDVNEFLGRRRVFTRRTPLSDCSREFSYRQREEAVDDEWHEQGQGGLVEDGPEQGALLAIASNATKQSLVLRMFSCIMEERERLPIPSSSSSQVSMSLSSVRVQEDNKRVNSIPREI